MEDSQIIQLYFRRSQEAIAQTQRKYSGYCYAIAYNILSNREDSEESVNDTYLTAWQTIPPTRPTALSAFLGKITRNLALNRWRTRRTAKRGGGEVALALEELSGCVAGGTTPEEAWQAKELAQTIAAFVEGLGQEEQDIFVARYWYIDPVETIARNLGLSQGKVKSSLHRIRMKLRKHLEQEGLL